MLPRLRDRWYSHRRSKAGGVLRQNRSRNKRSSVLKNASIDDFDPLISSSFTLRVWRGNAFWWVYSEFFNTLEGFWDDSSAGAEDTEYCRSRNAEEHSRGAVWQETPWSHPTPIIVLAMSGRVFQIVWPLAPLWSAFYLVDSGQYTEPVECLVFDSECITMQPDHGRMTSHSASSPYNFHRRKWAYPSRSNRLRYRMA